MTEKEFGDQYVEAIVGWQPSAPAQALVDELVAEWRAFTTGTMQLFQVVFARGDSNAIPWTRGED